MARDDYRDVDFALCPPDPVADEELTEPADRAGPLLKRLKRPISIAAVLALLAVAGVKLSSFSDGTSSAAQGGSTPAPTASSSKQVRPGDLAGQSITVKFPVADRGAGIITDGDPAQCPPPHSCLSTRSLPPAVLDAVQAVFPGTHVESSSTVQFTDHADHSQRLWLRMVHAVAGKRDINIRIVPVAPGDKPDAGYSGDGSTLLIYTHRLLNGYTVEVVAHLPYLKQAPFDRLTALATDERLLALP